MSVKLHIERVVVHGARIGDAQRGEFVRALTDELARLIGDRRLADARSGASLARLTAPAVRTDAGTARLARAVAGSVATALGREIRR
ncbi:hypothetical protein [Lysobacter antibioticus]|uniref:hypothetical protein n=1 Tax=Lysobacter antibioticus TaxID=84531 RepID=UPI0004D01672|nr:hypothetical protein [Lysobacter antibioticus]